MLVCHSSDSEINSTGKDTRVIMLIQLIGRVSLFLLELPANFDIFM